MATQHITAADAAIQAIRVGLEQHFAEANPWDPILEPVHGVEGDRGFVYRRRGEWAAYRINGDRVGSFATFREATAALGGRACADLNARVDAAIAAIQEGLDQFFAGDWRYAWAASEPMSADDLARALFGRLA